MRMAPTFTMCDFFAEGQYIHKDLKKRCFLIIDLRDFYVQEHTYSKKKCMSYKKIMAYC